MLLPVLARQGCFRMCGVMRRDFVGRIRFRCDGLIEMVGGNLKLGEGLLRAEGNCRNHEH